MLKLNETPVRTANNFRINNIEIDSQIPENISEFKNIKISKQYSLINESVSKSPLIYGVSKDIEQKANSKIKIENNEKTDNVKITYTFDDNNLVLFNQIDIVANKDINIVIEYNSNTNKRCFHSGIIKTFARNKSKVNVTIINFLNDLSDNLENVENTIEVIKKENTIYKENVQKIGQIEKIDETTMKIYLTEPVNFFEYFLCFPIIDINTYNTEIPMGTGKYKYTNITENQITIESSDNKIIVKLFKNSTELYNNFTRENVDIIITKNPNYENYIGNIGFEETIIPGRTFYYILLENISDVNMRKWLDMATNKEKLIYNLYNKKYIPANTPLAYGSYLNLSNEKQQEKDQELFTQKKMNLTISVKNEDKIIAEKMQEQLKEYEINLRIQTYQNSKADLILKKQTTTITPDISQYFSEEKMKKQIKQANEIENKQILKQKYQQILNEYKEQMPFISLFFDSYIILHNNKLKGDFSGNWYNIFYNVDGWYKSI